MGYNKRYKRLSELTIAELACNKNLDEINPLTLSRTLADDSSRRRE